ncbi:MAG TPA: hypothetical protein VFN94_03845, partial [Nitrospiria bacterium]|nr:hypothetical protein [Nitrospiria bacterium]
GVTLISREDEKLVRSRLHEIAEIAKEFLIRTVFLLQQSEPIPAWSGRRTSSISMADSRATLVVTDERILPTKDWKIKPEWCD